MDRKTLGKIVAERFPNLMKVVDLENWGILEIPSKGIKSPGNGRKEGERERERERDGGDASSAETERPGEMEKKAERWVGVSRW